jgi:uncharacterized protein (DUF983 family)
MPLALARRILSGEKWYEAHREHLYQRLARAGKSYAFVTLSEMGLQIVVLALMMLCLNASVWVRVLLIMMVIGIWLSFFAYAERRFKQVACRA